MSADKPEVVGRHQKNKQTDRESHPQRQRFDRTGALTFVAIEKVKGRGKAAYDEDQK